MRNIASTLFLFLLFTNQSIAQRFGYIDSQYILQQIPEYQEAEATISKLSMEWSEEIQGMEEELDKMELDFRSEEILLTPEMKEERLQLINEKREEIRLFQKNHFGYEGLLFVKRHELIKPLQDKIAKAAATVARKKRLQFLFDKSSDLIMIYSDPRHNYSDLVLEELDLGDPADTPR